jgi:hypothetical protein
MPSRREQFLENAARLCAAMGDPVPPCTPDLLDEADHAAAGEIVIRRGGLTYVPIGFGDIDWTCADTCNPPVVEMALRRYHMMRPLASAFRQTRDERYARAARRWIEVFLRDHPIVEGWEPLPGDGATQYDLRVGCAENAGWLGTMPVLLESDAYDDEFFETVVAAAAAHVAHVYDHVWPDRNIRALHGDVLLTSGLRLSFLPAAGKWRERGRRIINDVVRRQILPDGAHAEAAPGYHGVAMNLLVHMSRLARGFPELGLHVPPERVAAMHDYALATTRPDGAIISMHDTGYTASKRPPDTAVREARAAYRAEFGLPDELPPTCQVFPDAGQAFLRDSWGPDATYLTFDATPRGSWHWHPGRNTITLFAGGRALLVDTGYPFQTDEFPAYGTRTAHHATLNLNGWNQSYSRAQLRVRQGPGYDLVEGLYDGGYWPQPSYHHGAGLYGEHHRAVLWIRDRCFVVLDQMLATTEEGREPAIESVWQLAEGPVTLDESGRSAATENADANLLMLFPLTPEGTRASLHVGERDPMRGWAPIEWGRRCIPAPMIRLVTEKYSPWNAAMATVLVPFAGTRRPQVTAQAEIDACGTAGSDRAVCSLLLRWGDGSSDHVVWARRLRHSIDDRFGIDTDAALVHLRLGAGGEAAGGLAVDGSYVEHGGRAVAVAHL